MGLQAAQAFVDTAANFTAGNQILPANWLGLETDTGKQKIGDGVTAWTSLAYIGGGGYQALKTANQTVQSNATLFTDSALQFSMAASGIYQITIRVFFDTTAAADFKFALTGPASPTAVRLLRKHIDPNALTSLIVASEVAYTSSTAVAAGTGTTGGVVEFDMIVQNGVNAGTFGFQWAQNTSDASNTTVLAGSSLTYKRLA